MNMKRFALKGLGILAAVVAFCMFFSGTIRTLTTPKVRFAQVRMGKMEQETELTGKVVFPEEEELRIALPEGVTLTLTGVQASPGDRVKKGSTLATARVTDREKSLAELRKELANTRKELRTLEKKAGAIRLTRGEESWKKAWERENEARSREQEARVSLQAAAAEAGIPWPAETLPEEAGEEFTGLYEGWRQAKEDLAAAEAELARLERYAIPEESWSVLQQREEALRKQQQLEGQMTDLEVTARIRQKITAPRTAYVTGVPVEKGSVVDADTVLLKLTAEGKDPVIRVDLSGVKQEVSPGTSLIFDSDGWEKPSSKVIGLGMTAEGRPYADVEISEELTRALGNVSTLMKKEIRGRLVTRSKEATCLVPAAAVRGSGENRYVYIGENESSTFGGNQMKARKMDVRVLAESGSTVSLAEDLTYQRVLYMEDRALSEGCAVMEYLKEGSK